MFNMFGPQQQGLRMPQGQSLGMRMPQSMPGGPAAAQQGFQIPPGMAQQANQGILNSMKPKSPGMGPMAALQMAGMMSQQQPEMPLPPAYRAPMMPVEQYKPYRMFG